jgi:type II secretory pathway pseudopilin PulG
MIYRYLIIIALLLAFMVLALLHIHEQDHRTRGLESALNERDAQILTYRAANGKLISEKQVAQLRVKELQDAYPKLETELQQMKVKVKNLQAYSKQGFVAEGHGQATISYIHDTTQAQTNFQPFAVVAQDGYLNFQADVYDSLNAPYHYQYQDTITTVFHFKRKWFMGRKTLYSSSMLQNPEAKVISSTNVLVKEYRDKRFGIGPYVGMDINLRPSFGLSVQYSLIKF